MFETNRSLNDDKARSTGTSGEKIHRLPNKVFSTRAALIHPFLLLLFPSSSGTSLATPVSGLFDTPPPFPFPFPTSRLSSTPSARAPCALFGADFLLLLLLLLLRLAWASAHPHIQRVNKGTYVSTHIA